MKNILKKFFYRRPAQPFRPGREIDFNKLDLDLSVFGRVNELCQTHYGNNPGCMLSPHWQEAFAKDTLRLQSTKKLSALNWVGDGYPKTTKLRSGFPDFLNFQGSFENWETLDIQTGLHQFYSLDYFFHLQKKPLSQLPEVNILEIGGGYGRLALFFLAIFGEKCRYVNVDFVPTSLAVAPQVMRKFFPHLKVADAISLEAGEHKLEDFNYVSLPAWKVKDLPKEKFVLGINIHSFQEMMPKTVPFYAQVFKDSLVPGGILYFVNNPPDSWESHGTERYRPHSFYGLEDNGFKELFSQVNRFTDDWEIICGIPSLERILQK